MFLTQIFSKDFFFSIFTVVIFMLFLSFLKRKKKRLTEKRDQHEGNLLLNNEEVVLLLRLAFSAFISESCELTANHLHSFLFTAIDMVSHKIPLSELGSTVSALFNTNRWTDVLWNQTFGVVDLFHLSNKLGFVLHWDQMNVISQGNWKRQKKKKSFYSPSLKMINTFSNVHQFVNNKNKSKPSASLKNIFFNQNQT